MITHIAYYDKFIPDFIEFNESNFGEINQRYWIISYPLKYKKVLRDNIYYTGKGKLRFVKDFLVLLYFLVTSKKVFLHGMPGRFTHIAIFLCPWVLKRCHWLIWGADIYDTKQLRSWFVLNRIDNFIFNFIKRNAGFLLTYLQGDVTEARRRFGAKGKLQHCILYPSNTFFFKNTEDSYIQDQLILQVGHSSHHGNEHQKIFEIIKKFDNDKFEIHCPLAYGDVNNARAVSKAGTEFFGDRFHPINDFIELGEYRAYLAKIDIAIFNLRRQQAMGNIITLLGLGKKVVINPQSAVWNDFDKLGLKVFSLSNFDLSKLDKENARHNINIISSTFSIEALVEQYSKIYYG